jgi:hypothetical protein
MMKWQLMGGLSSDTHIMAEADTVLMYSVFPLDADLLYTLLSNALAFC